VYALGLALRGPLGSMVIAVDGLAEEKYIIVYTFFAAILSFALSTIAYFWVVETVIFASLSTLIVIVGIYFWYTYSIRIINKFQWDTDQVVWDDIQMGAFNDQRQIPSSSSKISNEGYLSLKDISFTKNSDNPWIRFKNYRSLLPRPHTLHNQLTKRIYFHVHRKYFVLHGSSLYYYENDFAAQHEKDKPQNFRPIEVSGYDIQSILSYPFSITLVPMDASDDRRVWEFRCDTLDEAFTWTEVLKSSIHVEDRDMNS
jgi:hypothetical protein